jgi:transposase, IS5 family
MRTSVLDQLPLVPQIGGHDHIDEMMKMSLLLDRCHQAAQMVLADLVAGGSDPHKGRSGLSGEQALRAAIVKQLNQYSYEQLAFHIADSMTYRAFCRIGIDPKKPPCASTLQNNIKKIRPETLEEINRMLLAEAEDQGIEDGTRIRSDCTVMESNIHEPSDSSLLWDCVRVLTRYLHRIQDVISAPFSDHTRRAKRRHIGTNNAKTMADRVPLYRDLIKVTEKTLGYAKRAVEALSATYPAEALEIPELAKFDEELREYIALTDRVLDQTRRRVLHGETVPAADKIVSIFEPHTDIIRKDRRETLYGHKLSLTDGVSVLILDCIVEAGNPADSTLAVKMVERQLDIYGRPPRQATFDGGFASKDNLAAIKKLEVQDVAFSKARYMPVTDMVRSTWVYKKLKRFRAGVEGIISFLKRCFGWDRCTWRSLESFKTYAWASVVAANLLVLARHALR